MSEPTLLKAILDIFKRFLEFPLAKVLQGLSTPPTFKINLNSTRSRRSIDPDSDVRLRPKAMVETTSQVTTPLLLTEPILVDLPPLIQSSAQLILHRSNRLSLSLRDPFAPVIAATRLFANTIGQQHALLKKPNPSSLFFSNLL